MSLRCAAELVTPLRQVKALLSKEGSTNASKRIVTEVLFPGPAVHALGAFTRTA